MMLSPPTCEGNANSLQFKNNMFRITKCFAGSESKSDDLNSSNLREKLGKIAEKANEFHVHWDATLSRSFGFLNSKQKKEKEKVTPESSVLYTQVIINGISPPHRGTAWVL